MKGFITRALIGASGLVLLAASGGCYTMGDFMDCCWPERYEFMARQEVNEGFATQAQNGHILDQTVFNYDFEYDIEKGVGTDRLTPAGREHLLYILRRRPHPDCHVFLQTAHDVVYDPAAPEKFTLDRQNLDARRIQAIQTYLAAEGAGRALDFQVVVHDPADPGISAIPAGVSIQRMYGGAQGILGGGVGGGGAGVAAGATGGR